MNVDGHHPQLAYPPLHVPLPPPRVHAAPLVDLQCTGGSDQALAAHQLRMAELGRIRRSEQAEKKRKYRASASFQARAKRAKTDPHAKWGAFKAQAKHRGIAVSITEHAYSGIVKQPCLYCGSGDKRELRGLDRVDSDGAYSSENVVSCCSTCNFMKRSMPLREFLYKVAEIASMFKRMHKREIARSLTL